MIDITLLTSSSQFLDAIASPSTYPCQSVGQWVSHSLFQTAGDCCCISELFYIIFMIFCILIYRVVRDERDLLKDELKDYKFSKGGDSAL